MPEVELKVQWEKWKDPFGENIDEVEWPGYNRVAKDETAPGGIAESDEEHEFPRRPTRVLNTTMGIIPLTEYTNPSKIFNFWVAHTNFTVSRPVLDIIEQTPGVELLSVFTRYRFRVGIGKVFKDADVMNDITSRVQKYLTTPTTFE